MTAVGKSLIDTFSLGDHTSCSNRISAAYLWIANSSIVFDIYKLWTLACKSLIFLYIYWAVSAWSLRGSEQCAHFDGALQGT